MGKIRESTKNLIDGMGLDLCDPNLVDTPDRIERMWNRFFDHYEEKPDMTSFPSDYKGLIQLNDHTAWGFCPHHLLPVRYTFNISYQANGHVLGASKLGRIAEYHLRTLPLQEDLTKNIAEDLINSIENCEYSSVSITGWHLCYVMRGLKSPGAEMLTEWICTNFRGEQI